MATATPNIKITDNLEGEKVLSGVELENFLTQQKLDLAQIAERETQAIARAERKAAAQAKLAALGLTVEDLQALGL